MKFGQLIECSMINIFLEKSYTKSGRENSSRPFSEKLKFSKSLDQESKFYAVCFYWIQVEGYQSILKLIYRSRLQK